MKRWLDWIVEAMRELDGKAYYPDLYKQIEKNHPGPLSREWKATVRRTVETYSSDSDNYKESNKDIFKSIGGKGSGYWGLR